MSVGSREGGKKQRSEGMGEGGKEGGREGEREGLREEGKGTLQYRGNTWDIPLKRCSQEFS